MLKKENAKENAVQGSTVSAELPKVVITRVLHLIITIIKFVSVLQN